jgi:nucleotide-binding universal stress UspA family protein
LYTAIIDVRVPGGRQMLLDDRDTYYRELQKGAIAKVTAAGLDVQALVIEGEEVQALVDRIAEYNPDLLVLGRRLHSTVSGLWNGTLHNIAEKVSCNILAVY